MHGVAGVDAEVEEDLLDLHRIDRHRRQGRVEVRAQLDGRGQRRAQQLDRVLHQAGEGMRLAVAGAAAAEGEHLSDQVACPLRRRARLGELALDGGIVVGFDALRRHRQVAEDAGEDVVEIVRDAAGELADRFHLLCLQQLGLQARAPVPAAAWRR